MHVAQEKVQLPFERYMKSKLKMVIGKQNKKLNIGKGKVI